MSATALGWTFGNSPYKGVSFAIHLAVADIVNDTYENKLWAKHETIAQKARTTRESVSRWVTKAIEDGLLILVEDRHAEGLPNTYIFLMPDLVMSDHKVARPCDGSSHPLVTSDHTPCDERSQEELNGELNKEELKEQNLLSDDSVADEPFDPIPWSEDVVRLCDLLADRVEAHFEARPNMPDSWFKDMDKLLRLGPLGWKEATLPEPQKVENLINWIFEQEPRNGFTWADNIRSPSKLRQQYVRLRKEALDSVKRTRASSQPHGTEEILAAMDEAFAKENDGSG